MITKMKNDEDNCSAHTSDLSVEEILEPGLKRHTCKFCGFQWETKNRYYVGYVEDEGTNDA